MKTANENRKPENRNRKPEEGQVLQRNQLSVNYCFICSVLFVELVIEDCIKCSKCSVTLASMNSFALFADYRHYNQSTVPRYRNIAVKKTNLLGAKRTGHPIMPRPWGNMACTTAECFLFSIFNKIKINISQTFISSANQTCSKLLSLNIFWFLCCVMQYAANCYHRPLIVCTLYGSLAIVFHIWQETRAGLGHLNSI